MISYNYSHNY